MSSKMRRSGSQRPNRDDLGCDRVRTSSRLGQRHRIRLRERGGLIGRLVLLVGLLLLRRLLGGALGGLLILLGLLAGGFLQARLLTGGRFGRLGHRLLIERLLLPSGFRRFGRLTLFLLGSLDRVALLLLGGHRRGA